MKDSDMIKSLLCSRSIASKALEAFSSIEDDDSDGEQSPKSLSLLNDEGDITKETRESERYKDSTSIADQSRLVLVDSISTSPLPTSFGQSLSAQSSQLGTSKSARTVELGLDATLFPPPKKHGKSKNEASKVEREGEIETRRAFVVWCSRRHVSFHLLQLQSMSNAAMTFGMYWSVTNGDASSQHVDFVRQGRDSWVA
ncbi:hypothetical protein GW17_00031554 [Ensete ventricosum]|nr:hypothetical protein GW17_00031554 [Ensete ventricosum]